MSRPDLPPFSDRLLAWFEAHGRKDLPWQRNPTAYRVWVSEIMLQQTQVRTVAGYFERFMRRFPDLLSLAEADLDEVLHLWSGLGYYARARNLHRAAHKVRDLHGGRLPAERSQLEQLPGIGRSTAGAILALSAGQRHAILDGNVKRILCRYDSIDVWPGRSSVAKRLWRLAEQHTPLDRVAEYTQAIMDLGATTCTRKRPACLCCPLSEDCRARLAHRENELPAPRPQVELPQRETLFCIVQDRAGAILLERRPPAGIWGGLWGFPECAPGTDVSAWCRERLGVEPHRVERLATVHHGFTHYRLDIHPVLIETGAASPASLVRDGDDVLWYQPASPAEVGLAAPVSALLSRLKGALI